MRMNIWTDCKRVPLPSLLTFIVDNRGKTVPTAKNGHILIATNCIKNNHLYPIYEKVRFLSQETYANFFRAHPKPGDIIFVNKGTPGRCALVPDPVDFCIAQDMMAFRVDNSRVNNIYLLSVLRSYEIQRLIYNISVGDVIPHFKKQMLDKILIPLPSLDIQKTIADFYSNINLKIENNRRICENLEAQAQALFKHWFIDFAPFKDGKFVESELGMIPEGWRVGRLEELGDIVGGATPSKAESSYYTSKGIAWLTPKDLSNKLLKFTSRGEIDITNEGYNSCSAKLMPKGSVLFSSRAPIGYLTIAKNDICTNQGFKSVVPKYAGTAYIYYLLKVNTKRIERMSSGTTFKEASGSLMKSLAVLIPPKSIIDDYEESVVEIFNEQEVIEQESSRLSTLRDTLLPRLMSGEISLE